MPVLSDQLPPQDPRQKHSLRLKLSLIHHSVVLQWKGSFLFQRTWFPVCCYTAKDNGTDSVPIMTGRATNGCIGDRQWKTSVKILISSNRYFNSSLDSTYLTPKPTHVFILPFLVRRDGNLMFPIFNSWFLCLKHLYPRHKAHRQTWQLEAGGERGSFLLRMQY